MRLIDADNIISVCEILSEKGNNPHYWNQFISIIEDMPTIDAIPVVHGQWLIRESGPGEIECKCSVCKYRDFVPRNDAYCVNRKFCPNCGAKMDSEQLLVFTDLSGAEYTVNPTV